MRLHNLNKETLERIKGGDMKLLKEVIQEDFNTSLIELIDIPKDKVERARGKASALRLILKVLD